MKVTSKKDKTLSRDKIVWKKIQIKELKDVKPSYPGAVWRFSSADLLCLDTVLFCRFSEETALDLNFN